LKQEIMNNELLLSFKVFLSTDFLHVAFKTRSREEQWDTNSDGGL